MLFPGEKTGLKVPLLNERLPKVASPEGWRVTAIVYVAVVELSCAVTMVVIVFKPTAKGIAGEALPDVTAAPFTIIVALALLLAGVTVIVDIALLTVSA